MVRGGAVDLCGQCEGMSAAAVKRTVCPSVDGSNYTVALLSVESKQNESVADITLVTNCFLLLLAEWPTNSTHLMDAFQAVSTTEQARTHKDTRNSSCRFSTILTSFSMWTLNWEVREHRCTMWPHAKALNTSMQLTDLTRSSLVAGTISRNNLKRVFIELSAV